MILLSAVLAGLLLGALNAWRQHRSWQPPRLRHVWLVFVGFSFQFFVIYLPLTRIQVPDWVASLSLIASQAILLAFCVLNHDKPGLVLLAAGLGLNLLAIVANGGFMPLPTETARSLLPQAVFDQLEVGTRLGPGSKDILLPESSIILPWLADRFGSPPGLTHPFAFSLGDLLIAAGVIWVLAVPDRPQVNH